jgi:hypothetical protein
MPFMIWLSVGERVPRGPVEANPKKPQLSIQKAETLSRMPRMFKSAPKSWVFCMLSEVHWKLKDPGRLIGRLGRLRAY